MTEANGAPSFDHLKELDLVALDTRRGEIVSRGKIGELPDNDLRELVAIAAQIRLRSGRVPKEEKGPAAPKAPRKKAASLEELDL
jgi:hypothetical protein